MDEKRLHVRLQQIAPIPLNVIFSCAANELLALVGPSGSGKSTILRSIAGLYRSNQGRIKCNDVVWFDSDNGVNTPPHRRSVGFVFQSYALFPHMTVLHNVTTALSHLPKDEREERAHELLSLVRLHNLENRRPHSLSGGEQQRVAVARALARDPDTLLLDEPFSAVDRRTRRRLREELAELRKVMRIPIVLVTHDIDEAVALSDRICVLDRGEILQIGLPQEIISAPASRRVSDVLDLPFVSIHAT